MKPGHHQGHSNQHALANHLMPQKLIVVIIFVCVSYLLQSNNHHRDMEDDAAPLSYLL